VTRKLLPTPRVSEGSRRGRRGAMLLTVAISAATLGAPIASAAVPGDRFFSEYLEGGAAGFAKAVEIYNGTGAPVDLAAGLYAIDFYTNGSATASGSIALTGSVADGDVFVVANPTSVAPVLAQTDQQSASLNFNGNDTLVLRHDATVLDVIGQIGVDPGTLGWGTDPTNTVDNDLVRKAPVTAGDPNGADAFDPAIEWDGFADGTYVNLGAHSTDTSGGGGGGGSDNGAVAAQVTVPSSAACIEISTSSIDFGTLPLGSEDQPGSPDISVTNCSGLSSDIFARGNDADDGAGAHWALADTSATCADTLGLDSYRLGLEVSGTETGLATTNKLLESLSSGASGAHTARIFTACPGSTGSGTTMSMQITFLATTTGG
jgi:hypothetical protein